MKNNKIEDFLQIGSDDHGLGKRSIWIYSDGSVEVLSQAHGLTAVFNYGPDEGLKRIEEIREAYAEYDDAD